MIDKKEKEKILKKILESSEFENTDKFQELLKYLVSASVKGKTTKEMALAIDVFGKDSSFDPAEDPTVRVYMSNLRKKLEHYYFTDGANDKIHLEIPKGHYGVVFTPQRLKSRLIIASRMKLLVAVTGISIVIMILLTTILLVERRHIKNRFEVIPKNNIVWKEFLTGSQPNMLVLGDYFYMTKGIHDEGGDRRVFYRDPRINSMIDYEEFIKKNSKQNEWAPLEFSYCRPSAALSLIELYPILKLAGSEPYVKLASELNWVDLEANNIVFVGSFKTLYMLEKLLEKIYIKFDLGPYRLYLFDKNWDLLKTFTTVSPQQGEHQKDYGLVVKMMGPNRNLIMILAGFDEIGILSAAKTVANPSSLHELFLLRDSQEQTSFCFKLVLESEGYRRTNFGGEITFFELVR